MPLSYTFVTPKNPNPRFVTGLPVSAPIVEESSYPKYYGWIFSEKLWILTRVSLADLASHPHLLVLVKALSKFP